LVVIQADFALFNVDCLVTSAPGCHPSARGELGVIERGALAAQGSKIVWVGPMQDLQDYVRLAPDATVLNTHGRTVMPGFVDPHTHPIFAGDRTHDFYRRALGESYPEQLVAGGIMHTVRATRAASEDALLSSSFQRASTFLRHGTTTIQAKTGYGLTRETELRALRVLARLQRLQPLKIVPSFLGAHVVPEEFSGRAGAYADEVIEWLPDARPLADSVDVWCDPGAFTPDQCRSILEAGRRLGFALTAHAGELEHGGGVLLAAQMGARSVDHAVYVDDADIEALAASRTVVVLLPGTTFFLGSDRYAPARRLIDAGIRVALGTDFNPGTSYTQNMQFILTLAVLKLGMSPEEAIFAATANAARAVGLQDVAGSLEPGKFCDLSVYCVSDYREIPYSYAMNQVETVVASGQIVVRDGVTLTVTPAAVAAG
jgi:imidazolonepropionase